MIEDLREHPPSGELTADLCVVGGGMAGITLALEFRAAGFSVLLLESGGLGYEEETQALYAGRNVGRKYFPLRATRSRVLGGSSSCWAGFCRPLDALDFEERGWIPNSGWPIRRSDLDAGYDRAQEILGLGPFRYDGSYWERPDSPRLDLGAGALDSDVFQLSAPLKFGEAYRSELNEARNIRVILHANLTHIRLHPDGAGVESLAVSSVDGSRATVRSRFYVLATGGIENARLLLASRDVHPRGVGNQNDLVGRYFMEHPHTDNEGLVMFTRALPNLNFYRPRTIDGTRVWGMLRPTPRALRQREMQSFAAMLYPAQREVLADPTLVPLSRALHETDTWTRGGEGIAPPLQVAVLGTITEQVPNRESRVLLDDDRDALDMPRAKLDWRLGPTDRDALRRAHDLVASILGWSGAGRFRWTEVLKRDAWPPQMIGGNHHMGTTRMHDDPKRGVVDRDCRVHGVANLFVAGSSVFPTVGCSNPTLTITALAVRLAAHLRGLLA